MLQWGENRSGFTAGAGGWVQCSAHSLEGAVCREDIIKGTVHAEEGARGTEPGFPGSKHRNSPPALRWVSLRWPRGRQDGESRRDSDPWQQVTAPLTTKARALEVTEPVRLRSGKARFLKTSVGLAHQLLLHSTET